LLVIIGVASFASMSYLTVTTIARDISQHAVLPTEQQGLMIWQLLLIWVAIGTILYLIARWEGRRAGFDYKSLSRDWQNED